MSLSLLVSIDTEEEFDWNAPVSPANRSVGHMRHLNRLQDLFEETGTRPTYLIDHPIATTDVSINALLPVLQRGACEIGAHLHPWVNPPIEEEICPRNTFLANLPMALQRAKLEELTRAIRTAFGVSPTSFKAGRYGFDFALTPVLHELGYSVDSSVISYYSFKDEAGPDFGVFDPEPFLLHPPHAPATPGAEPPLEIPCTVGFNRSAFRFWAGVHRRLVHRPWRWLRPIGILWRLGLLRKIVLSPEGFRLDDLRTLMRQMAKRTATGNTVLNLTLHSPSLAPGHTPYVRSDGDLKEFLATLRGALNFAVQELGAEPRTLSEFCALYRKDLAA